MASGRVAGIVEQITSRHQGRTEADLQSHIRELLASGALDLGENDVVKLEVPMGDGTRRRLDIELGNCCIEVKKKAAPVTEKMTDLLALLREHFFAPDGFGLKHLAGRLGATWRTSGATGETARAWVSQARSGDQNAWDSLLAYNEDDTRATQLLRSTLRQI